MKTMIIGTIALISLVLGLGWNVTPLAVTGGLFCFLHLRDLDLIKSKGGKNNGI